MSSQERHRNKNRYVFKGGNFILSPLNSKNIYMNYISTNRKEGQNKNSSQLIKNNLNPNFPKKNLNQEFIKSNPNLLIFSGANKSYINVTKINNNFINLTNNDLSYIKKLYVNKKGKENNYFMNRKSHNKNNLGDKKLSYDYLKTDIPATNPNFMKKNPKMQNIPNINVIFPSKNNFQKSNSNFYDDFLGSSSGLFKKDFSKIKLAPDKSFDHINIIYKSKNEPIRTESGTNQKTNESKNIKNNKRKEINNKGPEELHWYFVKSIQEGKKSITQFDF